MNRWVLAALLGMGALLALAGAEIVRLQERLAAKPLIEKSQEKHSVAGPTKIKKTERLIPQPDGKPPIKETVTETEIASLEKSSSSLIKEAPAMLPGSLPIRSYVTVSASPLAYKAVEVGGGLIFRQTLGIGARWAFYGAAETRPRLDVSVYFR